MSKLELESIADLIPTLFTCLLARWQMLRWQLAKPRSSVCVEEEAVFQHHLQRDRPCPQEKEGVDDAARKLDSYGRPIFVHKP